SPSTRLLPSAATSSSPLSPLCRTGESNLARQYLQDGPYIDVGVADALAANAATTATDAWAGNTFTPIFANDAKAGKIYVVEASGLITTAATGALTIGAGLGTSSPGTTLGASIAQTVPASSLSGPWFLKLIIV